jgi:hypothetical protein
MYVAFRTSELSLLGRLQYIKIASLGFNCCQNRSLDNGYMLLEFCVEFYISDMSCVIFTDDVFGGMSSMVTSAKS